MALKRQMEYDNTIAYLQGSYFVEALLATVGNMLSSKSSKRHDYPNQPYKLDLDTDKQKKESEQERQLLLFKAQLNTAMSNFNLSKSKEQGQS